MSQYFKCDICGKTLDPQKEKVGNIGRIKQVFIMEKQFKNMPTSVQENWDLCEDCQNKVWEGAEKLKREKEDENKK